MTRRDQIVYTAGFFDGEGCIQIVRQRATTTQRGYYYALRLTVAQCDPEPLNLLLALYGGTVKERAKRAENQRDQWVWIASAGPAVKALRAMLPYLIVKRAQANLALNFQSRREGRKGSFKELTAQEIKLDADDFLVMQELKGAIY